ncbi:MAG TPA: LpqB family beta-propeller domain-containing protein [Dehalococcoidia bacterium]|nr:LpqB family beta-propeller domain-containing protein [Dehalococcoidia bacterium]
MEQVLPGELIFVSSRDGNDDIYRVRADGSGLTNLTNDPGDDATSGFNEGANFDWSPDGERIAFVSYRAGTRGIYVMNSDGSAQTAISTAHDASQPRWSPDGESVMFVSDTDGRESIYLAKADGTGETRLHDGSAPDWSPDGESIAFVGDEGIMKMDADGSNVTTVVESRDQNFDVFWSPDGSRLLFSGYREGDNGSLYSKIFVVNEDGSGLTGIPPNTQRRPLRRAILVTGRRLDNVSLRRGRAGALHDERRRFERVASPGFGARRQVVT